MALVAIMGSPGMPALSRPRYFPSHARSSSPFPFHIDYPGGMDAYYPHYAQYGLSSLMIPSMESLLEKRSLESAAAFLVAYIEQNQQEVAATVQAMRNEGGIARLRLLDEAFYRFDQVVFDGMFTETGVAFEVLSLGPKVTGITSDQQGVLEILLNKDVLHSASTDETLATLLHHMIHAWILANTDPGINAEASGSESRYSHGKAFGSILHTIKEASSSASGAPLQLQFGHFLRGRGHLAHAHPYRDPYSSMRMSSMSGTPYGHDSHCTHCASDVKSITKSDCDKWFNEKCRPLLNQVFIYKMDPDNNLKQQERQGLDESDLEFVEFVWDRKNVYIPRSAIAKYPDTLGKQFHDKRTISIPTWVKKDIFTALYSFLTNDETYKPKLSQAQESRDEDKARAKNYQAPLMREYKKDWPAFILTDVKVYKLGKAISFDELCKAALKRLQNQHFTHEDVVAALTEVYAPSSNSSSSTSSSGSSSPSSPYTPDTKLRAWVRKFLARHYSLRSSPSPYAVSNLAQLHDGEFRHAWWRLMEKDIRALQDDVRHAAAELHQGPQVSAAQPSWRTSPPAPECGAHVPHAPYGGYNGVVPVPAYPRTSPPMFMPFGEVGMSGGGYVGGYGGGVVQQYWPHMVGRWIQVRSTPAHAPNGLC